MGKVIKHIKTSRLPAIIREERFLGVGVASSLVFLFLKDWLVQELSHPLGLALVLAWLFLVCARLEFFAWSATRPFGGAAGGTLRDVDSDAGGDVD